MKTYIIFDVGYADRTTAWFCSDSGVTQRFWNAVSIETVLNDLKGWDVDTVWLPHDAKCVSVCDGKSTAARFVEAGYKVEFIKHGGAA